jgi:hypothetical protein
VLPRRPLLRAFGRPSRGTRGRHGAAPAGGVVLNSAAAVTQWTGTASAPGLLLLVGLLLGLSACRTQRWPPPMRPLVLPLPGGENAADPPGLEEVIAVRHSAPVSVRQWGSPSAYILDHSHARERVRAGGWVLCGAGGRAEVLWPLELASVELFDASVAAVGERSRDEPALKFLQVSRARCFLVPGMRVALPGGATLSGDPSAPSGPFGLQFLEPNLLRVDNQAKVSAYVAFRDEVITLGPGQQVDLGLLAIGSGPEDRFGDATRLEVESPGGTRIVAASEGGARASAAADGSIEVQAEATGSVEALGLRVHLGPGQGVSFSPLDLDRVALSSTEATPVEGQGQPSGEPR